MELEKTLLSVEEFCTYMGIGKTKARELLSNPGCKYVLDIDAQLCYNMGERRCKDAQNNSY